MLGAFSLANIEDSTAQVGRRHTVRLFYVYICIHASAFRAELQDEYHGRDALSQELESGHRTLPFTCFVDDFGQYRNMYRLLSGIGPRQVSLSL